MQTSCSADISIDLLIAGNSLPCDRSGPGYVGLREPADIAPGTKGVLVMTVDGRESRWGLLVTRVVGERVEFEVMGGP